MASPEKTLVGLLYLSPARSRLFAALPELELPAGFRWADARRFVRLISAPPAAEPWCYGGWKPCGNWRHDKVTGGVNAWPDPGWMCRPGSCNASVAGEVINADEKDWDCRRC